MSKLILMPMIMGHTSDEQPIMWLYPPDLGLGDRWQDYLRRLNCDEALQKNMDQVEIWKEMSR